MYIAACDAAGGHVSRDAAACMVLANLCSSDCEAWNVLTISLSPSPTPPLPSANICAIGYWM